MTLLLALAVQLLLVFPLVAAESDAVYFGETPESVYTLELNPPNYLVNSWLSNEGLSFPLCLELDVPEASLDLHLFDSMPEPNPNCLDSPTSNFIPFSIASADYSPGSYQGVLQVRTLEPTAEKLASYPLLVRVIADQQAANSLSITGDTNLEYKYLPFSGRNGINTDLTFYREQSSVGRLNHGVVAASPGVVPSDSLGFTELGTAASDQGSGFVTRTGRLSIDDLPAGEHSITLWFSDIGLTPNQGVTQQFQIIVSHHWILAFLAILIALALSEWITAHYDARAATLRVTHRLNLCQTKLDQLTTAATWYPAVRASAQVSLTRLIAQDSRSLLRDKEAVENLVGNSEFVVSAIHRIQDILDAVNEDDSISDSQKRRARKEIRKAVRSLPVNDPNEALESRWNDELNALSEWTEPCKRQQKAIDKLQTDAMTLARRTNPAIVPDKAAKTIVTELAEKILSGDFTDPAQIEYLEQCYQKLKLLNKWQNNKVVPQTLVNAIAENKAMVELFADVDECIWQTIQDLHDQCSIAIQHSDRIKTLEPVEFTFSTGDQEIDNSFLFQESLKYEWEIRSRDGTQILLSPKTRQPRVVQFLSAPGEYTVSVRLRYKEQWLPANLNQAPEWTCNFTVTKSAFMQVQKQMNKIFSVNYTISFIFAALASLIYLEYDSSGFGTLSDYIMILLIGTAADKGRRFVRFDIPTAGNR